MIPLTGYADRLSVRPGETISFHVSHYKDSEQDPQQRQGQVNASLVRVICADPHYADTGAGIQIEPVDTSSTTKDHELQCVQEPGPCMTQMGSYAKIPLPEHVWQQTQVNSNDEDSSRSPGMAFSVNVMPTLEGKRQTIASCRGVFELFLDQEGKLSAVFGSSTAVVFACKTSVPLNQWSTVWCSCDEPSKTICLSHCLITESSQRLGLVPPPNNSDDFVVQRTEHHPFDLASTTTSMNNAPLILAARLKDSDNDNDEMTEHHWNGRLEYPSLWTLSVGSGVNFLDQRLQSTAPFAAWDFSRQIMTQTIMDVENHGLHGELINMPTRAVRGSNWTGREMCWKYASEEYAAIHFHATDLTDCHWPVCYQWKVPPNFKSGNYALLLESGPYKDNIPFFVVPPKGQKQADLAVIVSTFTYVIYGNHARSEWINDPNWKSAWKEQVKKHDAYPYHPREHPEYGWSTYNNHADGSGISLASWRRPMLNVRIGYITFPYPDMNGSGLRHYPADTHLTAWLEAQGIAYDVITDWELHTEGYDVLKPYRVVTTGTHPEYHSEASLQALYDYRDQGGRLMYLGGNGFYWKIAVDNHVLEIRRGEGGIRAWASYPGEYYHQLDGQYGGLWRRCGRAPQALAGVGFTAQGIFIGSYYKVQSDAKTNPRTSWIFQGVDDSDDNNIVGNHGLSGHGAAGFELDRVDTALGTPKHAVVVASSEGHPPEAHWILVFEEKLSEHGNLVGLPDQDLIRADMTFFETPSGGAVFSTGSITFCGSLLTNHCQNDISRLIRNVMSKFLDSATVFSVPPE